MPGYLSPLYAQSFAEIAHVRELPACGGWLLERPIPGTAERDAMGCYPLFCCARWEKFGEDLAELRDEPIAVSFVTDPFGEIAVDKLRGWFPDCCRAFKQHFVVDLSRNWEESISLHHRRRLRDARPQVQVELAGKPLDWLDDWCGLYAGLIERHQIRGIARFSRESFARQLRVPGIVVLRALYRTEVVGMLLWYLQKDAAYYHLGAFSPLGYTLGASYVLFRESLGHFTALGLRWAGLGAGAGIDERTHDGLIRFKRGWANDTRTVWFCGRILNRMKYQAIVESSGFPPTEFFPAYREREVTPLKLPTAIPHRGAHPAPGLKLHHSSHESRVSEFNQSIAPSCEEAE